MLLVAAGCAASTAPSTAPTPTGPAAGGVLAQLRTRGTLIVAIRVTAPAGGQQQLDAAHSQKRALEGALAPLAIRIIGPSARVEFREVGRDRASLVERGEADLAMTSTAEAASPNVTFSVPYASGGVVVAVKSSSTAADPHALAGRTIAATTAGEVNASEVAQAFFKEKAVTATLAPFPGLAAAVAALDSGQASAVVGDRTGIAVLQRGRAEPMRVIAEVMSRPYVIAVRKDAAALQAAVNDALGALISSGEIQKIATAASFPYESP